MTLKFKYDVQTLQWMTLFEKITKAHLKDCIVVDEKIFFVVKRGDLQKGLGPQKKNVTRLEEVVKKKVKIIEFNDDVLRFIPNVFSPLKVVEIKNEENVVTITGPDQKTKGLMIGAKARNLRMYEQIVQKFFPDIKEIKIV